MTSSLMTLAGSLLFGMTLAGGAAAAPSATPFRAERQTVHRAQDDLLTAGLGLAGLRAVAPPAFADAVHPTALEARRRAIWSNWRGIADLAPGGGYGDVYGGNLGAVPGREFSAYAQLPGRHQPHRVLVQLPDDFDPAQRCLVVTAASGSRGVYGAIAVAGAWGLPRGCAVAYTDKGAGSDYVDLAGPPAVGPAGVAESGAEPAFAPVHEGGEGVAFKHAHSQDNPEADWGRHVRQAAEYGLDVLNRALPAQAPFTFDNTRVIAVGISNGGGAVLRAAEESKGKPWLKAVVAGEPSVLAPGTQGRALYDYATEAALLMPCALLAMDDLPQPPLAAQRQALGAARCASLAAAGLLAGADVAAQAAEAKQRLLVQGWTEAALRSGALSVGFDLWRAVAVAYASAYGRYPAGAHPCGFGYAGMGLDGVAHAPTATERAAWWSDGSGIPPGAGVGIVDAKAQPGGDPTFAGVQCLRALWTGTDADARRVQAGVAQTRAALPRKQLPVIVVHGLDDGLIPPAFSSAPYVAAAQAAGRDVRYWRVPHAQHFDGFLGLPDYAARYVPLLPYVYAALDQAWAHVASGAPLPADTTFETQPRGAGRPLEAAHLAIPR
jgi:hydroxybutyrate-dimer hydrolase